MGDAGDQTGQRINRHYLRRKPVGDIDRRAGGGDRHPKRPALQRNPLDDPARRSIDHRQKLAFRAGDIGKSPVGRDGNASGLAANGQRRQRL